VVSPLRAFSYLSFHISRLSHASLPAPFSFASFDELIECLSAKEHKSADFYGHKFTGSQAPVNPSDADSQVFRGFTFIQEFHCYSPLSHDCAGYTETV
jgi:hypothetical protein